MNYETWLHPNGYPGAATHYFTFTAKSKLATD
jgi:hypothetical protein